MATTKIRGNTQIIAGTITNTEISTSANIATSKLADGANFLKRDGSVALTGDLDANSHKIINLSDPTNGNDATTKSYVDNLLAGFDVKQSVRAATTGNIALANLQTIDGVSLIAGNRVLVKNQTLGQNNGLYNVVDGGAWTRTADAASYPDLDSGTFVFVDDEPGSTQGGTSWVLTTPNPINVGTTVLTFTQFSGVGTTIAGAGLLATGNTFDVISGNAAIVVNADSIDLTLDDGSLEIVAGGLRVTRGTVGQVLVGNASGIPLAVSLGGDVTSVSALGVVTLNAATMVKTANVVTRETPTGVIDGSNVSFTLANPQVAGTEQLFLNGILQEVGGSNDYTIELDGDITFNSPPMPGDRLKACYLK